MGSHTTTKTITGTTGWKSPGKVSQYNEYGKVNNTTCYPFLNLASILSLGTDYAYIDPNKGGLYGSSYRGPRVYTYNYGFNTHFAGLPQSATNIKINNIHVLERIKRQTVTGGGIRDYLVKLKTGSSLTDLGYGFNHANTTSWPTSNYIDKIYSKKAQGFSGCDTSYWGASVVSKDHVSNYNFGCVLQCEGILPGWQTPRLYGIQMKIDYQYDLVSTYWVDPKFSTTAVAPKSVLEIGEVTSISVTNRVTNNESGTIPPTVISLSGGLSFLDGSKTCTIPSETVSSTYNKTTTVKLKGISSGQQQVKISNPATYTNTAPLSYNVIVNSPPESEEPIDQSILYISGCNFISNKATNGYGGAIYNSSTIQNDNTSNFTGNTATSGGNDIYIKP